MKKILAAALLCTASHAGAQSIEVASGDWSGIPQVRSLGHRTISADAMSRVEQILGTKGPCATQGSSEIDLRVPFLLEFSASGEVERIVIRRLDCEPLESLMGGVVRDLAAAGEYRPTGENPANWYRGEISYLIR